MYLSSSARIPGVEVDYCVLVDQHTFGAVQPTADHGLLLVAARVGTTRLIDNGRVVLGPPAAGDA